MNFNRDLLMKNFKEKNYSPCIEMLEDEIIRILSEKVKEKDQNFEYTNITNLRNICVRVLNPDMQAIVFKMHELMFEENYSKEQMLNELLILYKKLS